ncbi:MAG: YegS/Rv2252/BmrU family lipid kinase [Muribaculaceae bacterium]|nr:YegS/Rv2252/BmrU family lipid kinase [Muribaculaceae bacterium]
MEEKKKLRVIINPFSGTSSKKRVPAIVEKTLDHELFDVETIVLGPDDRVTDLAREAAAQGVYGVVAVGGDGTINGAATALKDTGVALGVVPCGSGNGLARHLGLPLSIKKSLELINRDMVEEYDYGKVNEKTFVCTCGMGFDAAVAYNFAAKSTRGALTYVRTALQVYVNFKPSHYVLELDGQRIEEDAFVIACANAAQYGNNAFIAPRASMQDGLIDITVLHPFKRIESPLLGLALFTRSIDRNTHATTYRTRRVVITREAEGPMHLDGEPMTMPARLDVSCHPGGIHIFSPTNSK